MVGASSSAWASHQIQAALSWALSRSNLPMIMYRIKPGMRVRCVCALARPWQRLNVSQFGNYGSLVGTESELNHSITTKECRSGERRGVKFSTKSIIFSRRFDVLLLMNALDE